MTKVAKSVFEKADPFEVAQARRKFITDNMQYLYTRECEASARSVVRLLSDRNKYEYVRSETLFEEMIANVLEKDFKQIVRAEKLGFTNAMGYDVLDLSNHVYLEAKDYQVGIRGGAVSPSISAMIGGLYNKFCSIVALITDPYNLDGNTYQLYFIPPDAIASDTSDCINLPHHKLICHDNVVVYEQLDNPGGAFSDYRIGSLDDLHKFKDRLKSVNLKKLARAIRDIEKSDYRSESQVRELVHMVALFKNCITLGNRKITVKGKRLPLDYNHEMFDISETDPTRLFFDGNKIVKTQARE